MFYSIPNMKTKMESDSQINWNCEMEVNLFHSMRGHKPVGTAKSFDIYNVDSLNPLDVISKPISIVNKIAEFNALLDLERPDILIGTETWLSTDIHTSEFLPEDYTLHREDRKDTGVNRHFQMIFIHDKLSSTYRKITPTQIWNYLGEMYDLQALNESEIVPFPNKELDFELPDRDFTDLTEKPFPRAMTARTEDSKTDSKPDKSDRPEKQDKHDKHDKHDKADKHEKHDKHEKADKHEKSDKHDKHEKHDRHEKHDKHDKHEKSDTGKHKSESRFSSGSAVLHTPENSPKRKRTRHTPSSTASPATPDAPPAKRGRR